MTSDIYLCQSCELRPVDIEDDICEECAWDIHSQLDGFDADDQ